MTYLTLTLTHTHKQKKLKWSFSLGDDLILSKTMTISFACILAFLLMMVATYVEAGCNRNNYCYCDNRQGCDWCRSTHEGIAIQQPCQCNCDTDDPTLGFYVKNRQLGPRIFHDFNISNGQTLEWNIPIVLQSNSRYISSMKQILFCYTCQNPTFDYIHLKVKLSTPAGQSFTLFDYPTCSPCQDENIILPYTGASTGQLIITLVGHAGIPPFTHGVYEYEWMGYVTSSPLPPGINPPIHHPISNPHPTPITTSPLSIQPLSPTSPEQKKKIPVWVYFSIAIPLIVAIVLAVIIAYGLLSRKETITPMDEVNTFTPHTPLLGVSYPHSTP